MKKTMLGLACGAVGAITTFFLVFLFYIPKLSVNTVNLACDGNCADADAIQVAMQLGRLDIVALALTFLGILLATLAIFGFVAIREKAVLQARDAAENATRDWLKGEGSKLVGQEVSKLLEIYEEEMTDKKADAIMTAFTESSDEEGGENG